VHVLTKQKIKASGKMEQTYINKKYLYEKGEKEK